MIELVVYFVVAWVVLEVGYWRGKRVGRLEGHRQAEREWSSW